MKNLFVKIIVCVLVLAVILGICAFVGNPVSWLLVWIRSGSYLDETYPEWDVEIDRIVYDFKHGGFTVYAASPTSRDTHFHMICDGLGNVHADHSFSVTDGGNTVARHSDAYRDLVASVLSESTAPFLPADVSGELLTGGSIEYDVIGSGENAEFVTIEKDFSVDASQFALDQDYDLQILGAAHGELYASIEESTVTVQRAAELLLQLRAIMDEAGVPFYAVEFTLSGPEGVDAIHVHDFLYADIYADGMTDRVERAHREYQAYQDRINGVSGGGETTPPTETVDPLFCPDETDPGIDLPTTLPDNGSVHMCPEVSTEPAADFSEYAALLDYYTYPETNWLRNAMGCVFETPGEIDLEFLFYAGFRDGSWDRISPESEQYLIDQGFWREMDLQPMPAAQLDDVLQTTFGISLADAAIPEEWEYLEIEDYYCSNHNDAYGVHEFTITDVTEHDDGRVEICYHVPGYFYNTKTDEFLQDVDLILTLALQDDGAYLVRSNVIRPEA